MRKILTIFSFFLLIFQVKAQSFYQISTGLAFTKINPKDVPSIVDYDYNISITKKHGLGARFGIDYEKKKMDSKWSYQTGLHLVFFTDKEYIENFRWQEEFVNGIYVFNPNLTHNGSKTVRKYFLEIPLLFRNTIKEDNRWTHFVDFGLGLNCLILSEFKSINGIKNGSLFNRGQIVPSLLLGVGLEYKYNDALYFVFRPNLTHTRYSIRNKLDSGISSFLYYGLDVSMKYPF